MANKTDLVIDAPGVAASATPARRARASAKRQLPRWLRLQWATPYLFLLPFLVLFVLFFFLPFAYDVSQSFYKERRSGLGLAPPKIVWTGWGNYAHALQDPLFLDGIKRVLLYGIVQIPVMMIIALAMALMMDSAVVRFRRFFRVTAFIPYAVPGVVAAIMWGFFYTPNISPIISIFTSLHLTPPDLLGPHAILWSIANISTWEFTGYNMIIFFSALQAIPQEIYEAGRVDGLSEFGIARYLKVPMIFPALVMGLLFSLIGTLQLFNEPEILTRLSGSISSTFTPNIYAYNTAFVDTNYYYGGAIAAILGVLTFAFSFGFLRLTRRQSGV
jgi:multiple sugar transport system permease protein